MTPLQIKYFLSVATTKSITKSAQELYVSVSAIGKQLVALEKEIGVVLLNRSNRGTELTEAGIEFFAFFPVPMPNMRHSEKNSKTRRRRRHGFVSACSQTGRSGIFCGKQNVSYRIKADIIHWKSCRFPCRNS